MKRKILLVLLVMFSITLVGCNKIGNTNNQTTTTTKALDHKVYKYVKATSSNLIDLIMNAPLFDEPSYVSYGDDSYKPTLIAEFDTNTGKATSVKMYAFFLDGDDDEWVNKAIEHFNSSTSENKKYYSNINKGRVNDNVSYLVADVEPVSYAYEQYIELYIMREQDIEKYKKETYYDNLYNYSTTPECEVGDNYFYNSLNSTRVEWSDSELKAY